MLRLGYKASAEQFAPGQLLDFRPYVQLGFRHLVFHTPGPDQARFIELYAAQVLPRLRRALG
jgi:coenzyme F420-dependent glucose-6-phosphate dehydrogenase